MLSAPVVPLVSSSWLAQHLADSVLLVLDIRSAESRGQATYEAGRIPAAIRSDYAADGWRIQREGAGGLFPEPHHLADLFGQLGITPERHVVIVSAGLAPADFSAALRVYWTLKAAGHDPVSILDGGVAGWTAADHPIAARPSKPQLSPPYPVRINSAVRALTSDIEVALQQGSATLLDARSRAQFEGREKSPQVTRAGRLPGDVHVDHTRAFESGTGRLRSQEELSQIFSIVASGDAVSYCNTGHLASTNWFVLSEVLGRPDVSLFGGSMSERTYDPGRPVEVGPSATGQGSERQG